MSPKDYMKIYIYDGVVSEYAKLAGILLREPFDTLYKSRLYSQIHRGVSDMHCRSDGYLAEELMLEVREGVLEK
jgi:hypothetical protein